ncbi:MAG: hypothetical protein M9938_03015 [Solirubrobacterales bacterium]|nr:hypothetical protein [Solirubrobacterales bacterium]
MRGRAHEVPTGRGRSFALATAGVLATLVLAGQIWSSPSAASSSPESPGARIATAPEDASISGRWIPRVTFKPGPIWVGTKTKSTSVMFWLTSRKRYSWKSTRQMKAIERHYRPRRMTLRFKGRTHRLHVIVGSDFSLGYQVYNVFKGPNRPKCKSLTRPNGTLKYRSKAGRFKMKVRVRCH